MARRILTMAGILLVAVFLAVWLIQPSAVRETENVNREGLGQFAQGAMVNFVPSPEGDIPADAPFFDGDGQRLTLTDFKGRVVLVNLWATWCAPCREEMPSLDRLQQGLDEADFEVVAIASDRAGLDAARDFLEEIGAHALHVYVDPSARIGPSLGVFGLPSSLLLDRDGRELGRLTGPAEWDSEQAFALIRAALAHP